MNLKINSFIVFAFLCCSSAFSQDTVKVKKVVHKIPAASIKPADCSSEVKAPPREILPVSNGIKREELIVAPTAKTASKSKK